MDFFAQMGPFQAPMLVLAAVVAVLTVWRAVQLLSATTPTGPTMEAGINSVLFWGVVSSLVGFLGFFSGVYASLRGFTRLENPGPGYVAAGVAESLAITIFGLAVLLLATIAWFLLRVRHSRLAHGAERATA